MSIICNLKSMAILAAALSGLSMAGRAAQPSVTYTASGTFAASPASGRDFGGFAGEPFQVIVLASETTKPIRHSVNRAEYRPSRNSRGPEQI